MWGGRLGLESGSWCTTRLLTSLPLKIVVFAYHGFFSVQLCGHWLLCFQASFGRGGGRERGRYGESGWHFRFVWIRSRPFTDRKKEVLPVAEVRAISFSEWSRLLRVFSLEVVRAFLFFFNTLG